MPSPRPVAPAAKAKVVVCIKVRRSIRFFLSHGGERHSGEADYALWIDVPLLVTQQFSASLRHRFQKRVERRGAAPFQIVLVILHQVPETGGVAGLDAGNAALVALA